MSHNENWDESKKVEENSRVTKKPKKSGNYKKDISFIFGKLGIDKADGWWNR